MCYRWHGPIGMRETSPVLTVACDTAVDSIFFISKPAQSYHEARGCPHVRNTELYALQESPSRLEQYCFCNRKPAEMCVALIVHEVTTRARDVANPSNTPYICSVQQHSSRELVRVSAV